MILAKVCLIGAPGVGKTSLVKRFVDRIFDERYLTTVGVKVDKKQVTVDEKDVTLMIWDLAGEDEFESVPMKYMRGAAAFILVADGCRGQTLAKAEELRQRIEEQFGSLPFVAAINKSDLAESWDHAAFEQFASRWHSLRTSAKSGAGVDELFQDVARRVVQAL
jgi:small GTP-binding protein